MYVENMNLLITDPCYIQDYDDKKRLSIEEDDTGYGDWGCTLYQTKNEEESKNLIEEHLGLVKKCNNKELGHFTADGGMVGIYDYDKIDMDKIESPDLPEHCYCIVRNFTGEIWLTKDDESLTHVIGVGNINFVSLQTEF